MSPLTENLTLKEAPFASLKLPLLFPTLPSVVPKGTFTLPVLIGYPLFFLTQGTIRMGFLSTAATCFL
jgi:hypothetical protein